MRELLGSARPSRPLDDATFKRGAERLARVSAAPAAVAAIGTWTKLAAAAVVSLAAVGTVVAAGAHHEPAVAAAGPGVSASSARAVDSARAAAAEEPPVAAPSVPEPPASGSPPPSSVVEAAPAPRAPARPKPAQAPGIEVPVAAPNAADARTETVVSKSSLPEELAKSSLPEELALLEEARRAIARSPELALAPLETHRARYPYGVLADERELMQLDVLRRVGRMHDARSRAHAWLARDPNGMFAPRVRAILATLE